MGRDVKRVRVDFDWPLNEIWPGFQMPESLAREDDCPDCKNGYSPRGAELKDLWYGDAPFRPEDNGSVPLTPETPVVRDYAERNVKRDPWFHGVGYGSEEDAIWREARRLCELWNSMWSHHLNQADVDALIARGRLMDFTHRIGDRPDGRRGWVEIEPAPEITAEQVNEWSLRGFGHDASNAMIAVEARCDREGVPHTCQICHGHGSLERYPGQRDEQERWEREEPPTGEGWQLWETVSEGSPISPVFPDAEGLAQWMASPAYTWGAARPLTISAARKFVEAGWSPSFMGDAGGLHLGDDYVGTTAVLEEMEG